MVQATNRNSPHAPEQRAGGSQIVAELVAALERGEQKLKMLEDRIIGLQSMVVDHEEQIAYLTNVATSMGAEPREVNQVHQVQQLDQVEADKSQFMQPSDQAQQLDQVEADKSQFMQPSDQAQQPSERKSKKDKSR